MLALWLVIQSLGSSKGPGVSTLLVFVESLPVLLGWVLQSFSQFHLMFGCKFLYLLPLAAGQLSEDSYARFLSFPHRERHASRSFLSFLTVLISNPQLSRQLCRAGNWCAQREGCILMLLPETLALFRSPCCHEQCQTRAKMSSFPSGGTKITVMGSLKTSKASTTSLLLLFFNVASKEKGLAGFQGV